MLSHKLYRHIVSFVSWGPCGALQRLKIAFPSPLYLTCFSLIIVNQPLLFYTIRVHLTPYQSTIILKFNQIQFKRRSLTLFRNKNVKWAFEKIYHSLRPDLPRKTRCATKRS
jgi:hypothetical protein